MASCKGPITLSSYVALSTSCYFALYVIMFHGSSKITIPFKFVFYQNILYLGRSSQQTLFGLYEERVYNNHFIFKIKKWI